MRLARLVLLALIIPLNPHLVLAQSGSSSSGKDTSKPRKVAGKTIDQWIRDLKDPDPGVQVNAAQMIPYFVERSEARRLDWSEARKALPVLIERLSNALDTSMRVNVCLTLGDIGIDEPNLPKAIDVLGLRLTTDQQSIVRLHAAVALMRLGTDSRPAIPKLVNATRDTSSWEIRRAAVMGLQAAAYDKTTGADMR